MATPRGFVLLERLAGVVVEGVGQASEDQNARRMAVHEQRQLLEQFEATFVGDGARRHSPKSSTFLDGVKGFWDRMVS